MGLGLIAFDRNQLDSAIGLLKQAAQADPEDVSILIALGVAFVESGLPVKATTIFAETVKRTPADITPRLHLTHAFLALERDKDALEILKQTVDDFPTASEAWTLKGRAERRLSEIKQAYLSFQQAARLAPNDPNILNDYGVACRAMGYYQEAEVHYRAALVLDPSFAIALANLGNVLDLLGDTESARLTLQQAVEMDPATPDALYNLACVLTKLEQPEQALPIFENLIESDSSRWDVLTNLGVTNLAMGDLTGAETALRQSL